MMALICGIFNKVTRECKPYRGKEKKNERKRPYLLILNKHCIGSPQESGLWCFLYDLDDTLSSSCKCGRYINSSYSS